MRTHRSRIFFRPAVRLLLVWVALLKCSASPAMHVSSEHIYDEQGNRMVIPPKLAEVGSGIFSQSSQEVPVKKSRFSGRQIITVLKQAETGTPAGAVP